MECEVESVLLGFDLISLSCILYSYFLKWRGRGNEFVNMTRGTVLFGNCTVKKGVENVFDFEEGTFNIFFLSTYSDCEIGLKYLIKRASSSFDVPFVVGIDIEWAPKIKTTTHHDNSQIANESKKGDNGKAALLQIFDGNVCLLFRLFHIIQDSPTNSLPDSLYHFLSSTSKNSFDGRSNLDCPTQLPTLIKCGVGIHQDCQMLQRDHGLSVNGVIDLSNLALKNDLGTNGIGLKSLTEELLGVSLDKSRSLRCYDGWNCAADVSFRHIEYAALDAWASREVFIEIYLNALKRFRVSPLMWYQGSLSSTGKYRQKRKGSAFNPKQSLPHKRKQGFPERKKDLYENCRMLSPSGELLCHCLRSKLQWYVDRGLGEILHDQPFTVRLTFQPKGVGHAGDQFHLSEKENKCVVCSQSEKLVRHSVVPHSFRKHFPLPFKASLSHDVVLLCLSCKETVVVMDNMMMRRIASLYNVDMEYWHKQKQQVSDQKKDSHRLRSLALALVKSGEKIPPLRVQEIEDEIRMLLGLDNTQGISAEMIKSLSVQQDSENPQQLEASFEKAVVQCLHSEADLDVFVKLWRKHFLDSMDPKALPLFWSIDYKIKNDVNKAMRNKAAT